MKYDYVAERTGPDVTIHTPSDLAPLLKKYAAKPQEHFVVVTLKGDHSVIRVRLVTIGTANRTMVHPREVFRPAITDNACAIIVAHNHPSGNLQSSPDDREVTARLQTAGEILGIPVLDHIIFSHTGLNSLVNHSLMSAVPSRS